MDRKRAPSHGFDEGWNGSCSLYGQPCQSRTDQDAGRRPLSWHNPRSDPKDFSAVLLRTTEQSGKHFSLQPPLLQQVSLTAPTPCTGWPRFRPAGSANSTTTSTSGHPCSPFHPLSATEVLGEGIFSDVSTRHCRSKLGRRSSSLGGEANVAPSCETWLPWDVLPPSTIHPPPKPFFPTSAPTTIECRPDSSLISIPPINPLVPYTDEQHCTAQEAHILPHRQATADQYHYQDSLNAIIRQLDAHGFTPHIPGQNAGCPNEAECSDEETVEPQDISLLSQLAVRLHEELMCTAFVEGIISAEFSTTGQSTVGIIQRLIQDRLEDLYGGNVSALHEALSIAQAVVSRSPIYEVEPSSATIRDFTQRTFLVPTEPVVDPPTAVLTFLTKCYSPTCRPTSTARCYVPSCAKNLGNSPVVEDESGSEDFGSISVVAASPTDSTISIANSLWSGNSTTDSAITIVDTLPLPLTPVPDGKDRTADKNRLVHQGENSNDFDGCLSDLIERVDELLLDVGRCQRIFEEDAKNAQLLIDVFRTVLNVSHIETIFRNKLVPALLKLCRRSQLHPTCVELKDCVLEDTGPVAEGGFGSIWKGTIHSRPVCIKMARMFEGSELDGLVKAFSKEATVWCSLSHPNVLPFYGLHLMTLSRRRVCLLSPWMRNGNLVEHLKRHPDAARPSLAIDMVLGLRYLHENGVIHGDIKGANILITDSGHACIADFGLASITVDATLQYLLQSSPNESCAGSVRWQAPEIFETGRTTIASDIYALGCVYYELFTGCIPFHDTRHDASVILAVLRGNRPVIPSDVPTEMRILMKGCWEEDPSFRLSTSTLLDRLLEASRTSEEESLDKEWDPAAHTDFRGTLHGTVDSTMLKKALDLVSRISDTSFCRPSFIR